MASRVDGFFVWVTDLDRAIEWYRKLGVEAGPRYGAWQTMRVAEQGAGFALHLGERAERRSTSVIAFAVLDLDAEIDRLSQWNIRPIEPDPDDTGTARFATFLDPDGNDIQLVERAPTGIVILPPTESAAVESADLEETTPTFEEEATSRVTAPIPPPPAGERAAPTDIDEDEAPSDAELVTPIHGETAEVSTDADVAAPTDMDEDEGLGDAEPVTSSARGEDGGPPNETDEPEREGPTAVDVGDPEAVEPPEELPRDRFSTRAKIGIGVGAAVVTLGVAGLIVANLPADDEDTAAPTSTVPIATTVPAETADPFAGVWRTIHQDGHEVEIVLEQTSDTTYSLVRTDEHFGRCQEFGAPVTGVITGTAEATGSELTLSYELITCKTDWGDVQKEFFGDQTFVLADEVLAASDTRCYRQGPPEPCEGVTPAELLVADPDIDFLIDEYGRDWVIDNYQGDLAEIGLDPKQLQPFSVGVCWPPADGEAPDLSGYRLHREPVDNLPRDPVGGPNETTWIYQRRGDNVTVFDQRQLRAGSASFVGVGIPRSDGDLVVFHTFGKVSYTTSANEPAIPVLNLEDEDGQLPTDAAGDIADFIADAYPVGDQVLVSRLTGFYRYDLAGNEVWNWQHGGQIATLVPGNEVFWGADREGNLYRIPLDGTGDYSGTPYSIPEAVWTDVAEHLRPQPPLLPVEGGVWVANANQTMVFVDDDGDLDEPVVVGPPPVGDGVHTAPTRNVICGGGYLWVENGDGSTVRIPLDEPTEVEPTDAMPILISPGIEWRTGASELFALDLETRERLGTWGLPDPEQGMWVTWAHDSLWISYQEGTSYQLRPGG